MVTMGVGSSPAAAERRQPLRDGADDDAGPQAALLPPLLPRRVRVPARASAACRVPRAVWHVSSLEWDSEAATDCT